MSEQELHYAIPLKKSFLVNDHYSGHPCIKGSSLCEYGLLERTLSFLVALFAGSLCVDFGELCPGFTLALPVNGFFFVLLAILCGLSVDFLDISPGGDILFANNYMYMHVCMHARP